MAYFPPMHMQTYIALIPIGLFLVYLYFYVTHSLGINSLIIYGIVSSIGLSWICFVNLLLDNGYSSGPMGGVIMWYIAVVVPSMVILIVATILAFIQNYYIPKKF
jgi:hypothetical protein